MHEHKLRQDMVQIGRLLYTRGLLVAMDGNLSALLSSGDVLCTKAGCHKGFLCDDDLLVVDRQGRVKRGSGRPTSELLMHLACYDERPDIGAVVHAHPPISVAFTIANVSMARCVLPEVVLTLGTVPTVPYATTGTADLATSIRPFVAKHDAILMDRHGAVCLGKDLLTAFCNLETMEHTALITKTARDLGSVKDLPADEAVKLRAMGIRRYGGPPSAHAALDKPGVDLPDACVSCSGCANPRPDGVGVERGGQQGLSMARVVERTMLRLGDVLTEADRLEAASAQVQAPSLAGALGAAGLEEAVVEEVLRALGKP
jgi:L-fuculose-phosphate aldolase